MNDKPAFKIDPVFLLLGALAVAIPTAIGVWWNSPEQQEKRAEAQRARDTTALVQLKASEAKRDTWEKDHVIEVKDGWGNYPIYGVKYDKEEHMAYHTVTSPGPDGEYNTGDDISSTVRDKNYTKAVAHWVGERSVDIAKGLGSGIVDAFTDEEEKENGN